MDILISNLLSESIFPSGSGQTENMQIRVFGYFPFDHFPKSQLIPTADLKWEGAYFYWRVLVIILKSPKMDFPLYFQKVIWPG